MKNPDDISRDNEFQKYLVLPSTQVPSLINISASICKECIMVGFFTFVKGKGKFTGEKTVRRESWKHA